MSVLLLLERLFLWFLFYSFIGWVYESIVVSIQQRRWVDRGFLNGPLCPIYGVGAVMFITLLGSIHNPVLLFLLAALGASVLEYVTSWAMERLFHARWWDYSDFPFNLNGRICLIGAVIFGFGGIAVNLYIQPFVAAWTAMIPAPIIAGLAAALFLAVVVDTTVTVAGIMNFETTLASFANFVQEYASKAGDSWQWSKDAVVQKAHEWSESSQSLLTRLRGMASELFNRQQQRMIRSFPHLRSASNRYNGIIETLRELFKSHK